MQISHFFRGLPGDKSYDYRDWKVAKYSQIFVNDDSFLVQAREFNFCLKSFFLVFAGIC